jgi:hypothetical protein
VADYRVLQFVEPGESPPNLVNYGGMRLGDFVRATMPYMLAHLSVRELRRLAYTYLVAFERSTVGGVPLSRVGLKRVISRLDVFTCAEFPDRGVELASDLGMDC